MVLALVAHLVFALQDHEEVVHVAVAMGTCVRGAHGREALLKPSSPLEVGLVKTSMVLGVLLLECMWGLLTLMAWVHEVQTMVLMEYHFWMSSDPGRKWFRISMEDANARYVLR